MSIYALEISKTFDSKRSALDFMQFIKADRILLVENSDAFIVTYMAERSLIEGKIEEDLPTS